MSEVRTRTVTTKVPASRPVALVAPAPDDRDRTQAQVSGFGAAVYLASIAQPLTAT